MRAKCPRCATIIHVVPGQVATCPNCQYTSAVPMYVPTPPPVAPTPTAPPGPQTYWPAPAPAPPPQAGVRRVRRPDGVKVFLLNLVLPGVGTLYGGRSGEGGLQLGLFVLAVATIPFLVGIALLLGVWVWALVTSFQLAREFSRGRRSPGAAT